MEETNISTKKENNSAKFAFFYMLSLVALGFTTTTVGIIIFQIINKNIIDLTEGFNSKYSADALKFAISAIIVSAPIFFITTWQINKNLFLGLLDKNSGIRKWLTYFIIFASSVTIIGYLISLIFNFLNGELTIKFILKTVTAIIISGIVFSYYFYDIKRKIVKKTKSSDDMMSESRSRRFSRLSDKSSGPERRNKITQIYFYGSLIIIIAALIGGCFFVESPQETRDKKQDYMVVEKFSNLERAINSYYSSKKKLPENFEELLSNGFIQMPDETENSKTKEKFEYKIISEDSYELCATFKTSNFNDPYGPYDHSNYYDPSIQYDQWPHNKGYQCIKKPIQSMIPIQPIIKD
ncbi:hypothetical protein HY750_01175 [Candidatus Kuenenbacteria bacterium]|nr:hypothetical protein [Candidatus Kuenenbacteria bacterium]